MIALHPRMLELGVLVDALDFSLVKMCSSVLGTGKLSIILLHTHLVFSAYLVY